MWLENHFNPINSIWPKGSLITICWSLDFRLDKWFFRFLWYFYFSDISNEFLFKAKDILGCVGFHISKKISIMPEKYVNWEFMWKMPLLRSEKIFTPLKCDVVERKRRYFCSIKRYNFAVVAILSLHFCYLRFCLSCFITLAQDISKKNYDIFFAT